MSSCETASVVIAGLNLVVLSCTFWILRGYARDTAILAKCSVEQLPRPCVAVLQAPDLADRAVLEATAVSIDGMRTLHFNNVGTARAVNVRFWVGTGLLVGDREFTSGPMLNAGETFDSGYPRNAMAEHALVVVEYESIGGTRYSSETLIEDRRWVKSVRCGVGAV